MRILFVSDARSWEGFRSVLDNVDPDVALFGGDLTSNGAAEFWEKALYSISGFRLELASQLLAFLDTHEDAVLSSRKIPTQRSHYDIVMRYLREGRFENVRGDGFYASNIEMAVDMLLDLRDECHAKFHELVNSLEEKYLRSTQFRTNRLHMHVDRFYEALNYAGKSCDKVFVVKGDHDEDFQGDYDIERINAITNCVEISGKLKKHGQLVFLGLGYCQTHYLRNLRTLVETTESRVDVVLTHAELRRVPLIAKIKPKIVFRGHSGSGKYEVEDVHTVSASFPSYVTVDFEGKKPATIRHHQYDKFRGTYKVSDILVPHIYPMG